MGIKYSGHEIVFEGIVHEGEAVELREHLKSSAPLKIEVDLTGCKDMHTSIIQLICAYNQNYECQVFYDKESNTTYLKALKGCGVIKES